MVLLLSFLYACLFLTSFIAESTNTSSTEFLSNIIGSFFRGPNSINITRFLSTFQLPACMKECVPEIDGLLMALSRSNNTRDFVEICSELHSSTYCASSAGCSKIFIDAATSAFQFVCLDNIQAISDSIRCVKTAAIDVQAECEAQCAGDSPNLDGTSHSKLEAIFQVPRVCNSTRCLLTCFKTRIDNRCRIGKKNLLDSLLAAVMRGEDNGFENAIEWILPESCQLEIEPKNFSNLSASIPYSVGQVVRNPINGNIYESAKITDDNFQPPVGPASIKLEEDAGSVEAVLLVDGQIRTLRYQMFDWQGNPLPPPDLQTLSKILMLQPLFLTFSSSRDGETVILPSEQQHEEGRKRHRTDVVEEQEKENDIESRELKKQWDTSEAVRQDPTLPAMFVAFLFVLPFSLH